MHHKHTQYLNDLCMNPQKQARNNARRDLRKPYRNRHHSAPLKNIVFKENKQVSHSDFQDEISGISKVIKVKGINR